MFNTYNNGVLSPCKGCKDRSIYCHSKCEKYNEFLKLNDEHKKKLKSNNTSTIYAIEQIANIKSRKAKQEKNKIH